MLVHELLKHHNSTFLFQVGCTVLAALLHFFLLAVFAWMLCEGVLLYILLVKVFGGSPNEKVKYFLVFGWCKLFVNRFKRYSFVDVVRGSCVLCSYCEGIRWKTKRESQVLRSLF